MRFQIGKFVQVVQLDRLIQINFSPHHYKEAIYPRPANILVLKPRNILEKYLGLILRFRFKKSYNCIVHLFDVFALQYNSEYLDRFYLCL